MKKIIRNLDPEQISFRAFEEDGKRYLEGYASVFNQKSKILFENNKLFTEIIDRHAFDEALQREDLNVVFNFNHENDRVLGRTKSGTLQLSTDDVGLHFRALVPNTTLGNDVYELVSRSDLFENSFAFIMNKGDDEWSKDEEGNNIRVIKKIAKLYDVSVVVDAAYSNTDIFARDEDKDEEEVKSEEPKVEENSLDEEFKRLNDEIERMKMHLKILKFKN